MEEALLSEVAPVVRTDRLAVGLPHLPFALCPLSPTTTRRLRVSYHLTQWAAAAAPPRPARAPPPPPPRRSAPAGRPVAPAEPRQARPPPSGWGSGWRPQRSRPFPPGAEAGRAQPLSGLGRAMLQHALRAFAHVPACAFAARAPQLPGRAACVCRSPATLCVCVRVCGRAIAPLARTAAGARSHQEGHVVVGLGGERLVRSQQRHLRRHQLSAGRGRGAQGLSQPRAATS